MARHNDRRNGHVPGPLDPSPLTLVQEPKESEDPILDASFILDGAKMLHKGGKTPLDVILAERAVPVTEEGVNGSREAVLRLVEAGLVPYVVLCWIRELEIASSESTQWTKWLTKMTMEGKHLRSSMAVRFGEYRLKLMKAQMELGKTVLQEVLKGELDHKSRQLVQSYLPRGVNPVAQAIKDGQNPLVNGAEPSTKELAKTFDRAEEDPETNFSIEPEDD